MTATQDLLDRGLHYYGLGEVKRAAELWRELLRQEPGHREATKYLDYLRGQRPEIFNELDKQPEGTVAGSPSAARQDWANNVPASLPEGRTPSAPPESQPQNQPATPREKPRERTERSGISTPGLAPPVGDPFDLLGSEGQPARNPLLDGALDLFKLNDFEGALELLNKAERQGATDEVLFSTRAECESQLLKLYEARIGDQHQTPKTKVASGELVWLNLDNRAGFILSLVDGAVSYEEIFSLSGMSRLDTVRVLAQLVRDGIIGTS